MPLLNKRPLERAEIPTDVGVSGGANRKVYHLEASNEIFFTYDDYFERMIQLNSTLWSCEFTGRTGLTYFEAVESEQEALKSLGNFPNYLERPILFLVMKYSCRGRFEDLLNDVCSFMKERYFIGEECFFVEDNKKKNVKVVSCKLAEPWSGGSGSKKDIVIVPASLLRYTLQLVDEIGLDDKPKLLTEIASTSILRNKNVSSKPKLKLFLKNACYMVSDRYEVKGKFLQDGIVQAMSWNEVFTGPEPNFPQTPMLHRGKHSKANGNGTPSTSQSDIDSLPSISDTTGKPELIERTPRRRGEKTQLSPSKRLSEKKKQQIREQQEELFPTFEKARKFEVDLTKYENVSKVLTANEISTLKAAIKEARNVMRESNKEARKMKVKQNYEWKKKRDDLECEDLKPLPLLPALNLPSWMNDEEFSEYITILQFFTAFQELLPIKEIRGTSRVSLSDIIVAVRCSDPQLSPYADLMRILLTARTDRADEEDGDEADLSSKDEIALIQLQNCDPDHRIHGENIRAMNDLHEDIRSIHGQSVRSLPVDWMTLTEVLRLILNTSGYYTGMSTHRHRLFMRGNYKGYEDAGYIFRHEYPDTMEKLKTDTVFDLQPFERLALMKVIISQLLSFYKFRNHNDERLSEIIDQRRELKKLRAWNASQEQEAREGRLAREYELEQMEKTKGKRDQKSAERAKPSPETTKLKSYLKAVRDGRRTDKDDLERILLSGVAYNELDLEDIITASELQRVTVKEGEDRLLATIYDSYAISGQLHMGRDRAFRNYFLIEGLPGVLVENPVERDHIGSCLEATPIADSSEYGSEEAARHFLLGCSGNMATCAVHGEGKDRRPRWSYIDTVEKLNAIIDACNPRGFREVELAEELTFHKGRIAEVIEKVNKKIETGEYNTIMMIDQKDPVEMTNSLDWEQEMIELLLDFEEKIEQGLLGRLPVPRAEWRHQLNETGDVTPLIDRDVAVKGAEDEVVWSKDELSRLTAIQKLAVAFLQLIQGISLKFYRTPFSQASKEQPNSVIATSIFLRWQRALLQCESVSAISLFLSTLEPAILWDKSRLQGKCRLCRRKGAAETLVLCTECDKCFHLDCVHVTAPAPLDWRCSECQAAQRKRDAAERRKINKEIAMAEQLAEINEDEGDENSMYDSERDADRSVNVVKTSSGRAVKKVVYNDSFSFSTPPLLKKRNSTRSNGHTNGRFKDTDDEYDSEASSTPRLSSRKRKAPKSYEDDTPSRNISIGLRESNPEQKERMNELERIIRIAMKEPYAWPFLEPVDVRDVPDYYDIISRPMDLHTMINKMKRKEYDTAEEIRSDGYLIVANCKEYNEEGSEIYECAAQLEDFLESQFREVFVDKRRRR